MWQIRAVTFLKLLNLLCPFHTVEPLARVCLRKAVVKSTVPSHDMPELRSLELSGQAPARRPTFPEEQCTGGVAL